MEIWCLLYDKLFAGCVLCVETKQWEIETGSEKIQQAGQGLNIYMGCWEIMQEGSLISLMMIHNVSNIIIIFSGLYYYDFPV